MSCAWNAYIRLLPVWMREDVDRKGKNTLLELRLRLGLPPELITTAERLYLSGIVRKDDLNFCINTASQYSPWASDTTSKGYITAQGGHRVGICGIVSGAGNQASCIRQPTSLNLRVARDFENVSEGLNDHNGSVLIIGRPGSGKTTFLRDLIRRRCGQAGECVGAVDEKGEIFPHIDGEFCFPAGRTDVLTGFGKKEGIENILRNMSPDTIAVDEITASEDCQALLHAAWCGVKLLATAHAGCREDLIRRPVYRPLFDSKIFDTLVILNPDRTWRMERMNE